MPFIIDGHNLIPAVSGIHLTDMDDEEQLVKRLLRYCQVHQTNLEVYFDKAPQGYPRTQTHGRVKVIYTPRPRTADDAIRTRLRLLGSSARNWTVVSSDRQVVAAARGAGAKRLSASEFALEIEEALTTAVKSPSVDKPLDAAEVDEWLRLFGDTEE